MIVKIVALFIVGMMVLAMFGRLRAPGAAKTARVTCPDCGKRRFGHRPCGCKKGK